MTRQPAHLLARAAATPTTRCPTARFDFWFIPGQGSYWKLRDGLRFELWTAGLPLEQFVKFGRKTRFCMRDLIEVPGLRRAALSQVPAPATSPRARSRCGWGSRRAGRRATRPATTSSTSTSPACSGCFSLRHVADPLGHVFESDESNNMAQTRVRLPPRRGRVRGC